jgi:hypothetical protein
VNPKLEELAPNTLGTP